MPAHSSVLDAVNTLAFKGRLVEWIEERRPHTSWEDLAFELRKKGVSVSSTTVRWWYGRNNDHA